MNPSRLPIPSRSRDGEGGLRPKWDFLYFQAIRIQMVVLILGVYNILPHLQLLYRYQSADSLPEQKIQIPHECLSRL